MIVERKTDIVRLIKSLETDHPDQKYIAIHQCNCFHTMGAGIAKALAKAFPEVLSADKKTAFGVGSKLGTYSAVQVTKNCTVYNLYSQYMFGSNSNHTDYDAMYKGLKSIVESNKPDSNVTYIIPRYIGAGLSGGNHEIILNGIIMPLFSDEDVILVSI